MDSVADMDDRELLRRYAEKRCEADFAELVNRHLNMVWGVARRITRDEDQAKDVAQAVFIDLERKASALRSHRAPSAWLYQAAVYAARKSVRAAVRRARHERQAMEDPMHSQIAEPGTPSDPDAIASSLDSALARLPERDRTLVVMRFLSRKSHSEIGAALGISENAAQKRTGRALGRLRGFLQGSGMRVSVAALASALLGISVKSAPAGLAAAVVSSSVAAGGAAAGMSAGWGTALLSAKVSTATITMKTQLVTTAAVLAGLVTPVYVQHQQLNALEAERDALSAQMAQLPQLEAEHRRLLRLQRQAQELARLRAAHEELLALRDEVARLRAADAEARLQAETERQIAAAELEEAESQLEYGEALVRQEKLKVATVNASKNLGLAARIFATDNADRLPGQFGQMARELGANFSVDPATGSVSGEFPGGVSLEAFEWFPQPRRISEMEPGLALFREKEPRQLIDGRWERTYTFVDGSVLTHTSETGDFSEWDRRYTASPEIPESLRGHSAYEPASSHDGQQ